MTHDPLCPTRHDAIWEGDPPCKCNEYAKVREDERRRIVERMKPYLQSGEVSINSIRGAVMVMPQADEDI